MNFPDVVRALTAAISEGQVLSACSRGTSLLLRTRQIAILLCQNQGSLLLVDGAGFPNEARGQLQLPIGDGGLAELLAQQSVTALEDHPEAARAIAASGLVADLAVSITHGEQVLGLVLVSASPLEGPAARRLLAMVADLTAVALNAARQVSKIREQAEHDALTGLANRAVLFARAEAELRRSASYQSCTSLAMIDIDHFKRYNDQNGHAAGDEVLRKVAHLIAGNTRRTDLVARYGGEEFTVILRGADREAAAQHAERLRRVIADHQFPNGNKQPLGLVSISVGLATFPGDAINLKTLFEAADKALYQAKNDGRNRVVSSATSEESSQELELEPL